MKKPSIVLVLLLIGVIIGAASLLWQYQDLQVQILRQTEMKDVLIPEIPSQPQDCGKLSEDEANSCYTRKALEEMDITICDQISKASQSKICRREVELAQ